MDKFSPVYLKYKEPKTTLSGKCKKILCVCHCLDDCDLLAIARCVKITKHNCQPLHFGPMFSSNPFALSRSFLSVISGGSAISPLVFGLRLKLFRIVFEIQKDESSNSSFKVLKSGDGHFRSGEGIRVHPLDPVAIASIIATRTVNFNYRSSSKLNY